MLSLLVTLAFSFSVRAEGPLALRPDTACEKRYVVSFMNAAPGFFTDEKGNKQGSSFEILQEVIRRLGCKVTEETSSHFASTEGFVRNRVDIFGITNKSEKMNKTGEFVEMYRVPRSLVIRKDALLTEPTIESVLKNKKINFVGIIGGLFFIKESEKEKLFKEHRLREVPGPSEIYTALDEGRAQATFSSPAFTAYYLGKSDKLKKFKVIPDHKSEWQSLGFYLSTNRLSKTEREKIKGLIHGIRQDGTLLNIQKKYVQPEDFDYYHPEKTKDVGRL
ncbi:substrate-binding periplasmic protein [Bdellovibrio sp. HCB209]|uniref:substrate-binding periplasmic protein n=1 Tax=Bdellovibrio sp. HCB209 TaxID=3394354 RepID=UPI0039B6B297